MTPKKKSQSVSPLVKLELASEERDELVEDISILREYIACLCTVAGGIKKIHYPVVQYDYDRKGRKTGSRDMCHECVAPFPCTTTLLITAGYEYLVEAGLVEDPDEIVLDRAETLLDRAQVLYDDLEYSITIAAEALGI